MTNAQFVAIIESTVALAGLVVLFLKLVPAVRLDIFRQKMFALRDDLFDYALDGNISFQDPAYRLLRQSMNGYIRYAHNITFYRVFIGVVQWKLSGEKLNLAWNEKWETALTNLKSDEVRCKLLEFHNRATFLFIERLVIGSPFLIAALVIAAVMILFHTGLKNLKLVCEMAAVRAVSFLVDPNQIQEEAIAYASVNQ